MENTDEKKKKQLHASAVSAATADVSVRGGKAVNEYLKAYDGKDASTGQTAKRSLKSISESKVSGENADANMKQQAGYSAEVQSTAKENADNYLKNKKAPETKRTDDIKKQSDGKGGTIGGTNDEYHDKAKVDSNGNYIEGSGSQMKFIGKDGTDCANKLMGKSYDKYRDKGVPLEVPSDYYDDAMKQLSKRENELKKWIEKAKKDGNSELAAKHEKQLERVQKTKSLLKKSNISKKEAEFARKHPKLQTAKNVLGAAHEAGMQGAVIGAVVGGSISLISNIVAVIKGEKDGKQAAKDFAFNTAKSGGGGYLSAFTGTALAGAMKHSSKKIMGTLAGTSLPAYAVQLVESTIRTMSRFFTKKISGEECLIELGENGATLVASAAGATAGMSGAAGIAAIIGATGSAATVISVAGSVAGGMVGTLLCSLLYKKVVAWLAALEEARIWAEKESARIVAAQKEYQRQVEETVNEYLAEYSALFKSALSEMDIALEARDADRFIKGANAITEKLGGEPDFGNMQEFDALMNSDKIFVL